jgi:glycosyltransferase involved in cell wall biosynthesis
VSGAGGSEPPAPASVAYVLASSEGGTGAHVAMLAAQAARHGMAVSVLGPADAGRRFFAGLKAAERPAAGSQIFAALEISSRPRPARDLAAVLRLRGLLRRLRPDVVHAHGLRAGAFSALALTGMAARPRENAGTGNRYPGAPHRYPLVVTVHNAPLAGGWTAAAHSLLERLTARRAAAIMWVSADIGERMRRRGARDGGRALVPALPGVPPPASEVASVREDLAGAGQQVVLAAGRLAAQKGFGVLLAAARRWREMGPQPLAVIAGDGPLAGPLARQAIDEGLAVRFLGHRDDVPALLAAADVVVVPSLWEGQPLLVQEAMRAGRPLVVSRCGGVPDLTGEDGALLIPPGDAAALAEAVRTVLADPALAARLSAAARRRAASLPGPEEAFTAAAVLYRRLTSERSGA